MLVKGDRETLREIEDGDDSTRLVATGAFVLEDFEYEFLETGDAADEFMARYAEVGSQIGYLTAIPAPQRRRVGQPV